MLAKLLTADCISTTRCPLCQQPASSGLPCLPCQAMLTHSPVARCDICAQPLISEGSICQQSHDLKGVSQTYVLQDYGGLLAKAIREFKYRRRHDWLSTLQWAMARLHEVADDGGIIVPIPTHWRRRLQRGFDHIDLLSEHLPNRCRALSRRYSPPLEGLDRSARQRVLQGSFTVRHSVQGKHILLVDDVTTSGTTFNLAAKVLRQHGAYEVSAMALCKTKA